MNWIFNLIQMGVYWPSKAFFQTAWTSCCLSWDLPSEGRLEAIWEHSGHVLVNCVEYSTWKKPSFHSSPAVSHQKSVLLPAVSTPNPSARPCRCHPSRLHPPLDVQRARAKLRPTYLIDPLGDLCIYQQWLFVLIIQLILTERQAEREKVRQRGKL